MADKNGIFIFTKNREKLLKKATIALAPLGYSILVVDDTPNDAVRANISAHCKENRISYHGKEGQEDLIKKLRESQLKWDGYLKVLGDGKWNLGYARNHALLLAARHGIENILFIDDDITINEQLVKDLFAALRHYDIVGSRVTGMPDDSILGHIASKIGIVQTRLYSGGCLAFKAGIVDEYFMNIYNEDWIWQMMQLKSYKHQLLGDVEQELFDPFEKWQQKIFFQEIGETIVDGLENAIKEGNTLCTTQLSFWNEQIVERKAYLQYLLDKCREQNDIVATEIVNEILQHYPLAQCLDANKLFEDYFQSRQDFQKAYTACSLS